ncbi:MAG: hypothetical protein JWM99_501 [Verrucomicrobiales bacterium]|nr:hypothetical protein [Verrucomicrobiales bacterium]
MTGPPGSHLESRAGDLARGRSASDDAEFWARGMHAFLSRTGCAGKHREKVYVEPRKMNRRVPKSQTRTRRPVHTPPANDCRALVAVDGTNVRRKIKKEYETALRDLDLSRKQVEQFHQTDLPEFTRWLNTNFGALLTQIRELSHKIALDEQLIYEVQDEVIFGSDSFAHAYKRVIELRENPEPAPPPRDSETGPETERRNTEEDPPEDFFDQLFDETGSEDIPRGKGPGNAGHHSKTGSTPQPFARLKELYRSLVRRLHPDTQREMTPQKAEWWHQAQAAYQSGDAEQLEVILTLCEIGESGTTERTSASLLQRITSQLKSSLREIKRQLSSHRKDPAWNFSQRSDRDSMTIQMRRNLTSDLQLMRERWRETQEVITEWQSAAARLKKRPRRKRHPENDYY